VIDWTRLDDAHFSEGSCDAVLRAETADPNLATGMLATKSESGQFGRK
jgi:hypothetical protein